MLEIHVFGAGEGESILIRLPSGEWGAVDSLKVAGREPALDYLKSRDVKNLAFVCLTHPHQDHYKGLLSLLEMASEFWNAGLSKSQLISTLTHDKLKYAANKNGISELTEIYAAASKMHRSEATCRTNVYPLQDGTPSDVLIRGIAPAPAMKDLYMRRIMKAVESVDGTSFVATEYSAHNMISIALQIEYGDTRVLLCGDVESDGWREVERKIKQEKLKSTLVKVSHHGSDNGYSSGLWKALSPDYAVLTPFQKHRLPTEMGLCEIKSHSRHVFLAGSVESTSARLKLDSLVNQRKRIHDKFSITEPAKVGRCSFWLNNRGTITRHEIDGSASKLH